MLSRNRGNKLIRIKNFNHRGGHYFYRIHEPKIDNLCNGLTSLKDYLAEMFENCPDDYFYSGPRSSKLKFKIDADLIRVKGHHISGLCEQGLKQNEGRYKTSHSRVQVFMLENDKNTIACEIPIWAEAKEIEKFEEMFNCKEPLTGHIDILRVEDGNVWVWDYKPKAKKEKYASTQVFFYCLMLSKRTGIPIDKFRCGYFDEHNAFMFKPNLESLNKKTLLDY